MTNIKWCNLEGIQNTAANIRWWKSHMVENFVSYLWANSVRYHDELVEASQWAHTGEPMVWTNIHYQLLVKLGK